MTIHTRIRALGAAALLALAVAGVTAQPMHAEPKGGGSGVYCTLGNEAGSWDDINFYLPGQIEYIWSTAQGRYVAIVCGEDGQWHLVRTATPEGPVAPRPVVNAP